MQWVRTSVMMLCVGLLGCGDEPTDGEAGDESETTGDGDDDGDGDSGDGDGDSGDSGDGDGDSGDGDGDPGDGDPGDGDPGDGDGDGDGDPVCDPAGLQGMGIAENPWGLGDTCDEIYVCVSNVDFDALVDLLELPEENCMSDLLCGDGQRCTLSYQTMVDQQTVDDACAALTIVDTVWCVLWGP